MTDQPPPTQPVPPTGGASWQGVQPVVERPTEALPPTPPPPPPPAPPGGGPVPGGGAGGGGTNRGVIVAIVLVALAILGVGGFLLLSGDDDDEDRVAVDRRDDDEETTTTTEDEETTTTSAPDDGTTTSSAPPDTTATTVAPPAGELTFVEVTDDTGQLVVEVPDTWTVVDGTPLSETSPNVQASTDLAAFRQLDASGVSFTLLEQQNADPDTTLDFLTSSHVDNCDVQERQDYDDGVFTGRLQELSDCNGEGVSLVVIVATNEEGQSVEVSTIIVPPDPLDEIEQRIIETFNIV